MKKILAICCLLFISQLSFARNEAVDTSKRVSTTGNFDTLEAKSGYWINGYYVEISNVEFQKYKGKKVKVTGKLMIIKGLTKEEM